MLVLFGSKSEIELSYPKFGSDLLALDFMSYGLEEEEQLLLRELGYRLGFEGDSTRVDTGFKEPDKD